MRDLDHYLDLFYNTDTVGHRLLARAIYAGRYGSGDGASSDELSEIQRSMPGRWPDPIDADRARVIADVWGWTPEGLAARVGPALTDDPQRIRELADTHAQNATHAADAWRALDWIASEPEDAPWTLEFLMSLTARWTGAQWISAGLELDPTPPWAIDRLARRLAGEHPRDRGRGELAEWLDVSPVTVSRWINETHACTGAQAKVLRMVAREVLCG